MITISGTTFKTDTNRGKGLKLRKMNKNDTLRHIEYAYSSIRWIMIFFITLIAFLYLNKDIARAESAITVKDGMIQDYIEYIDYAIKGIDYSKLDDYKLKALMSVAYGVGYADSMMESAEQVKFAIFYALETITAVFSTFCFLYSVFLLIGSWSCYKKEKMILYIL